MMTDEQFHDHLKAAHENGNTDAMGALWVAVRQYGLTIARKYADRLKATGAVDTFSEYDPRSYGDLDGMAA